MDSFFPEKFLTLYYDTPSSDGGQLQRLERIRQPCVTRSIAIDMRETPESYIIDADIAGFTKDQVSISFDEGSRHLSIKAKCEKKKHSEDQKGDRWIIKERSSSQMIQRSLELPKDASADNTSASFNEGVLSITIPRKSAKRTEIAIQ